MNTKYQTLKKQSNIIRILYREDSIDGGLLKSPDGAMRTTNSMAVPSIDEHIKIVTENGGQVVVPKTEVPNMGYFAYCLDNQGLLFGLSEVKGQ